MGSKPKAAEYKPSETDRFGAARNQNRHLNETDTFHDREKQIVTTVKRALDHEKHPDPTRHDKQQMPEHHRHKVGGVYGHHYFGLPPKMRHNLVNQIKAEHAMIDEFAGRNAGKIEREEAAKAAGFLRGRMCQSGAVLLCQFGAGVSAATRGKQERDGRVA